MNKEQAELPLIGEIAPDAREESSFRGPTFALASSTFSKG